MKLHYVQTFLREGREQKWTKIKYKLFIKNVENVGDHAYKTDFRHIHNKT